ncbi:hypothetical protein C1H46_032240 [Malus baccata]|uniref:Cytochrome P450 n=1 Tax=Malus baccata TaxID=106549 RepID=A0A540L7H1_MALBA|nr:hypothetical protein C1H46_032240 [Malus baccata]
MPHRTLAELKHKFGPVIWLRVGARNTMVIQSAKAAANHFKNHDISLAGRTTTEASQVYDYHKGSLALAPYGSHWRVLRRLVTVDMLVNKRINETSFVRKKCLEKLQLWIEEEASKLKEGHGVHVASLKATGDEPAKISDHDVNIFILEIFLACSETTRIEWALTELLCNPEKLIKAKAELTQVIGPSCRKVEEGDIEKLPYLQENPDVWDDEPAFFKPERFIGTKWDCKGQHFEFIPFGSGRRVCAGLPLAHRMLHLTLGMFLHQFDWELGGDVTRGNIDWKDKLGITMRKSEPSLNTWSNGCPCP